MAAKNPMHDKHICIQGQNIKLISLVFLVNLRMSELESLTQKVNVRMVQAAFYTSCFGCLYF